ncbi:hypothetical protein FS837_009742 [Tulasnella sp. UAMH 9824]|nr:hypothetical protein FS837_009742 [Tulasnella sp. UAMH 9824]
MVNRSLRSICEDRLYTSISLDKHPWRSVSLLETFLLRPDLALCVQHLEISGFYETNAFALAKNVRSLTLAGLPGWVWMPERTCFRAAVSKMDLIHLKIQGMCDGSIIRGNYQEWDGDSFKEMLAILQTQPSLESLSFVECKFSSAFLSDLGARLSRSDVPALKSLAARPEVAAAFLRQINGLQSITLAIDECGDLSRIPISMGTAENRVSVRELTIRVPQTYDWAREQVSRFLALFPSIELLRVVMCPRYFSAREKPEGVKVCLDTVPSQLQLSRAPIDDSLTAHLQYTLITITPPPRT